MKWLLVLLSLGVSSAPVQNLQDVQDAPSQPQPVLKELKVAGATIFSREDILWMLEVREGSPLPKPPAAVATTLQEAYARDGYVEARVTSAFEDGRLSLTVDEGRIDEIEILGITGEASERARRRMGIKAGDIYNKRTIGQAVNRFVRESQGALAIGRPRASRRRDLQSIPSEVTLERRGPRNILVVPFEHKAVSGDLNGGSGREDLFSPVDGFAPGIAYSTTIFDHAHFNHAFLNAFVSYKFGRDAAGYSIGGERPVFRGPRLFLGAELHDLTASDDLWRLSSAEQTLVSIAFKNTFRDYYRRRGGQVFTTLRMGANSELSAMARWDRHEPLANATSYSFFRDDAVYRPNTPVVDRHINALVLGYTFDSRPLSTAGEAVTYQRHLKDNLFGQGVRQQPGVRLEWTSEIAGHGLAGDADFDRHIVQARGYIPVGSHTQLSLRGLFGFSNGTLPIERQFAIGGIGSVHGYRFKEASGTGMTLLNAEYRLNLTHHHLANRDGANVFVFYDAGRVSGGGAWLRGVGVGAGAAGLRVEVGFRANEIPRSRQILVRFSPTF
jgi:outer membrane protein assembly factor BamA